MLIKISNGTGVVTWLCFELKDGTGRAQQSSWTTRIDKDFPSYAAACAWVVKESTKHANNSLEK